LFERSESVSMPNTAEGFSIGLWRFEAGDLNGDGQVDLFLTGCCGGGIPEGPDGWQTLNASNSILLSDGPGKPKQRGRPFGLGNSETAALGDLDGDGDLDAFIANSLHLDENGDVVDSNPNEVWLNDGRGTFTNRSQLLGEQRSYAVALGDLDGDGDLDAIVGNRYQDEIWYNDGRGNFSKGDQMLGNSLTRYLYLQDFDGDADLDAFIGSDKQGVIWLNDGHGQFSDSGQHLKYSNRHAVAIGDVNNDGTVDILAGNLTASIVWLNDGKGQMNP